MKNWQLVVLGIIWCLLAPVVSVGLLGLTGLPNILLSLAWGIPCGLLIANKWDIR